MCFDDKHVYLSQKNSNETNKLVPLVGWFNRSQLLLNIFNFKLTLTYI